MTAPPPSPADRSTAGGSTLGQPVTDLDEAIALTTGTDLWHTAPVPSRGLGPLQVTDGPSGARGAGTEHDAQPATAFPVGSAMGATWDPELLAEIGAALAAEARAQGAGVLLGPTVNLQRHVLAGRNFECFSEDPYLSARLAVAYVRGLQDRGVGACVKHFVANETEDARHWMSSEVDERTLREVYLQPFEAAVRDAGAWSVMSAYNRINGTYASDHHQLLEEILRDEWGFDGAVVSDWGGTMSLTPAVEAGVDLEMPGPPGRRGERLAAAVAEGTIDPDRVRTLATRVADLVERAHHGADRLGAGPDPDDVAHRAAVAGMVLLTDDGTLPLAVDDLRRVAVIGPGAERGQVMGGGSSRVRAKHLSHPLAALRERLGPAVEVTHHPGCGIAKYTAAVPAGALTAPDGTPGALLEVFAEPGRTGSPAVTRVVPSLSHRFFGPVDGLDDPSRLSARLTARYTPAADGPHTVGLAAAGAARLTVDGREVVAASTEAGTGDTFMSFGTDEVRGTVTLAAGRPVEVVVELDRLPRSVMAGTVVGVDPPAAPDDLDGAAALAAEADVAVVVVGLDGAWETEGNDRRTLALPGAQDDLVRAVAAANPRTVVVVNAGSPVALPWVDDVAVVLWAGYPGQAFGAALAAILVGDEAPSGRLPVTWPRHTDDTATAGQALDERAAVAYREGLHLGHRHHDRTGVDPLFAFGHGLTYTSFTHGPVTASAATVAAGGTVTVEVPVTNAGGRAGVEVVQAYLSHPEATVDRPARELRGFARVVLAPGETAVARIELGPADLARWDVERSEWVVDEGPVVVALASSAATGAGHGEVRIEVVGTVSSTAAQGRPSPSA